MTAMVERLATALMKAPIKIHALGPGAEAGELRLRFGIASELARLLLAEMREPTEAMSAAAYACGFQPSPLDVAHEDIYRAMIDAALGEGEPDGRA